MSSRIFISYRRADSRGFSHAIYNYLVEYFGEPEIFMDVDDIEPGSDFHDILKDAVDACDVMLVLIGPKWISITDAEGNRRLDNPLDFVRIEVSRGLERNIKVIPVMVDGAQPVKAEELPDSMKSLARRNVLFVGDQFNIDMDRLIPVIERELEEAKRKRERETKEKQQPRSIGTKKLPKWALFGGGLAAIVALTGLAIGLSGLFVDPPNDNNNLPSEEPNEVIDPPVEPVDGLWNGMTLEEIVAAGYVVVAPGEPVRIGASVDIMGGNNYEFGVSISNSYQLAISDLNAAGGLMGNYYEIDIKDCFGDIAEATGVAYDFVTDPTILAVAGGTCPETPSFQQMLMEARIPHVTANTASELTRSECDICNRVSLNEELEVEVDAEYIFTTLGVTRVVVVDDYPFDNNSFSPAEQFQFAFEDLGGTVVSFEEGSVFEGDYSSVIYQILSNQPYPEMIFFYGGSYHHNAAILVQEMEAGGYEPVNLFFGLGDFYMDSFSEQYVGSYGVFASVLRIDEAADKNAEFEAKYQEMWGETPNEGVHPALAYDSIQMIAAALESVAHTDDNGEGYLFFDREEIVAAVRGTTNLQGLTGTITCDEIGDCGAGGVQIFQVQGSNWVQVSGFGMD